VKGRAVGIVGTGLIGGSVGMRVRRNGGFVVGYDADTGALARALEIGAIDMAATRDELYAQARTVVIAAHVDGTIAEIDRLKSENPIRATLIIDVASVKRPVVDAAGTLANFVATHPMAGREQSGVRAARADLFEGKTWTYVPSGDGRRDARARAFIASLGAAPLAVDADEHDRIVGLTSHALQVLAWAFGTRAQSRDPDLLHALAGSAARELVRLGNSPFPMWREILSANARQAAPELRALGEALIRAADAIESGTLSADVFEGAGQPRVGVAGHVFERSIPNRLHD
jgi:prephenate dehydrogenase